MNKDKEIPQLELIPYEDLNEKEEIKKTKNNLNNFEINTNLIKKDKLMLNQKQSNQKLKKKSKKNSNNSQIININQSYLKKFDISNENSNYNDSSNFSNIFSNESTSFLNENSKNKNIESLNKNDPYYNYKENLTRKIESIKDAQKNIKIEFEKNIKNYQNKIFYLENLLKEPFDEKKFENLKKINKKNKELIQAYENEISKKEIIKIKEKKEYFDKLNELFNLKSQLIKEINEIEILAKEVNKINLNKFKDPILIEKLNFNNNFESDLYPFNELSKEIYSIEKESNSNDSDKISFINKLPENFINNNNNNDDDSFKNVKNFVGNFDRKNNEKVFGSFKGSSRESRRLGIVIEFSTTPGPNHLFFNIIFKYCFIN